jgi:DNA-binding MarR family transcriptional regulator
MAEHAPELAQLLARAARTQRTLVAAGLSPVGLHPGQDALLRCLWSRDGQTQSELVETLGVEPPTVTKMVHRLEEAGFVTRRPYPGDRRVSTVWLTDDGRRVRQRVQRVHNGIISGAVNGLSADQTATLCELLSVVADNLDNHRNGNGT